MPIFTNLLLDKLSATRIRKPSYIEGDGQVQVPALTEAAGTEVGQVASHRIVVLCTQLLRRIRKERKKHTHLLLVNELYSQSMGI